MIQDPAQIFQQENTESLQSVLFCLKWNAGTIFDYVQIASVFVRSLISHARDVQRGMRNSKCELQYTINALKKFSQRTEVDRNMEQVDTRENEDKVDEISTWKRVHAC